MKKIKLLTILFFISVSLFARGSNEQNSVIASTSWTAAIAILAGVEDILVLAPSEMVHPPEYELKASDILALNEAKAFIYAGYEVMMKDIKASLLSESRKDVQITTQNDLDIIINSANKIAEELGTIPNYDKLIDIFEISRTYIQENKISELAVYSNTMLKPMLDSLGFNVVATYTNQGLTAKDIQKVASGEYDLIIDNIHSPAIDSFSSVANVPILNFRNFPLSTIENMIEENIQQLKLYY